VSRNFRLDERIPPERVEAYGEVAGAAPADANEWHDEHVDYLGEALWIEQPPSGLPKAVFPEDPDTCAETFRTDAIADLSSTDQSVELLRMERLGSIADAVGLAESAVENTFAAATQRNPSASELALADAILGRWARTRDLRPVWAAFSEDCHDILDNMDADSSWPSVLRDRLGLIHLDPAESGRPIAVVVFRYPVGQVPTVRRARRERCLAFPSVIDGHLSAAFCPTPSQSTWGRVVDLTAPGTDPAREVLHPPTLLRAKHILGVGTVGKPAVDSIAEARAWHLLWLQDSYGRAYGDETDRNLLA